MKLTTIKEDRPIIRRVGTLVIRISREGISIRRYRCRKWRLFTWEMIAALPTESQPIIRASDHAAGEQMLRHMGISLAND